MSRVGYIILLALLVGLGTYVYWPEPGDPPLTHIWTQDAPTRYRVIHGDLEQEIDGDVVHMKAVERPLDADLHQRLWRTIKRAGWIPTKVINGVREDQLDQYGIDGTQAITCEGLIMRWGKIKDVGYIWDGLKGRILISDEWFHDRLTEMSQRMDVLTALEPSRFTRITVDNLNVALMQGTNPGDYPRWRDAVQPQRPDFNMRVNKLYDLLSTFRITDLTIPPPRLIKPLHTLRFATDDPTIPEQILRLWTDTDGLLLQVDKQPVQKVTGPTAQLWKDVIEKFDHDYLFNLYEEFAAQPLAEVRVLADGSERFRLEKHGLRDDVEGRSQWDVVWPGGREPASAEAAPLIAYTLDQLQVREPRKRLPGDDPAAAALKIIFVFQQDRKTMEVAIDNGVVYSATHVAKAINLPEFFSDLTADRMLDPALTFRGAERVVKVQRQWHQGEQAGRAEVFAVQSGSGESEGVWTQTYPKEDKGQAVSTVAIDQLVRALCTAKGTKVRLHDKNDRAALAHPDFEMDVRFAPAKVRLSNDHSRLVDTNDQDLGFAFVRQGGQWRAIDKEGGVSYGVTDELVEMLQAPLIENLVIPLIPSLVNRIDLYNAKERIRLMQVDGQWRMQLLAANGGKESDITDADEIAVRRHLRLLAGLRAVRVDPKAGPFSLGELYGTVVCVFPGADSGDTRVTLTVGPTVDNETAVVVEGGKGMRGLPRGRVYVDAEIMRQVFPSSKTFSLMTGSKKEPVTETPQ